MDWWHKIRRTWTALSTRIKLRKSAGVAGGRGSGVGEYGGGDCGGTGEGLLKLRDDVQMCGYRDVEVMWNMLNISLQPQQMETARTTKPKRSSCKQRSTSTSRLFFLTTNHNP
ncbi:hypothetical protein SESBI_05937 [Sesbania bispinosa]|nr:hypothetical protein SESBI_05937 [Sesbania bispinosa]